MLKGLGITLAGITIGAAAGAGYVGASQSDNMDPKTGAMIGFASVPASVVAGGIIGLGAYKAAPYIGRAAYSAISHVPNMAYAGLRGATSLAMYSPVTSRLPAAAMGLMGSFVDFKKDADRLGTRRGEVGPDGKRGPKVPGVKLRALGHAAIWGTALFSGAKEAYNEFEQKHMGQMMPGLVTPAPRTPSYLDNAGATGDLVFAMNKNRRG